MLPHNQRLLCAAALVLALLMSTRVTPAEAEAASPASVSAAALQADAAALFQNLIAGQTDAITARATPELKAALSADQLRSTMSGLHIQNGAFNGVRETRQQHRGDMDVVTFVSEFERADVDIHLVFDANRRLAGISVRPARSAQEYASPDYVQPSAFNSREVVVDAGGWPLPGTLTVPNAVGPFPAVVLVHGSGPSDRDASFGPNKIFRDIAEGLSSRGIAVLRFEKRTQTHAARIATLTQFTPKEELIDDARAAADLLRNTPGIRADAIYVLGHSLGGMLAPRIATTTPSLAGIIVMAGAVRPLELSVLDQTKYLAEFDGTVDSVEQTQIAAVQALVARVRTLQPGDPPVIAGGSSAPASYWLSMRDYDPAIVAGRLALRMLILQGARDYQVTMADFEHWRDALRGKPDVRTIAYPSLNHLFVSGAGKSHPNEYAAPGHVDRQVIDDIAAWIRDPAVAIGDPP